MSEMAVHQSQNHIVAACACHQVDGPHPSVGAVLHSNKLIIIIIIGFVTLAEHTSHHGQQTNSNTSSNTNGWGVRN